MVGLVDKGLHLRKDARAPNFAVEEREMSATPTTNLRRAPAGKRAALAEVTGEIGP